MDKKLGQFLLIERQFNTLTQDMGLPRHNHQISQFLIYKSVFQTALPFVTGFIEAGVLGIGGALAGQSWISTTLAILPHFIVLNGLLMGAFIYKNDRQQFRIFKRIPVYRDLYRVMSHRVEQIGHILQKQNNRFLAVYYFENFFLYNPLRNKEQQNSSMALIQRFKDNLSQENWFQASMNFYSLLGVTEHMKKTGQLSIKNTIFNEQYQHFSQQYQLEHEEEMANMLKLSETDKSEQYRAFQTLHEIEQHLLKNPLKNNLKHALVLRKIDKLKHLMSEEQWVDATQGLMNLCAQMKYQYRLDAHNAVIFDNLEKAIQPENTILSAKNTSEDIQSEKQRNFSTYYKHFIDDMEKPGNSDNPALNILKIIEKPEHYHFGAGLAEVQDDKNEMEIGKDSDSRINLKDKL